MVFRQIAGYVARRIVFYCNVGDTAKAGHEFGFIKFGSRVDIFLPLTAKVLVSMNQKVTGKVSVIAELES